MLKESFELFSVMYIAGGAGLDLHVVALLAYPAANGNLQQGAHACVNMLSCVVVVMQLSHVWFN